MEPWLLNWTVWVTKNTQAEFDGITYKDGSKWFEFMWYQWLAHSDYGHKLKQEKALIEMMRLDEEAGLYDLDQRKTNNKNVIKVDLSGCKNMKECSQVVELIASGKVKIIIENNNE